jgi:predicted ATPase
LRPEEQQALEVASVMDMTFTAAEVAAGCKQEEEAIEDLCEHLVQQGQFIEAQEFAEWPDGTISAGYGFRHALYQYVLYERLGRSQRMRLHQLIGERLEAAYRGQEAAVAGRLATHFAQGREYGKALRYHQLAAEEALRRSGYEEMQQHCSQGLALLAHLPTAMDRTRQELALQIMLSTALAMAKGFAAETLSEHLQRAHVLCQEVGDTATLVPVLIGLGRLYHARGDRALEDALQVITEALHLTETTLEAFWQAELHRLKGELTLARSSVQSLASSVKKSSKSKVQGAKFGVTDPQPLIPDPQGGAEACFRQAIDVARRQRAKSLELRAVMSLARLWRLQGKRSEAHQMLSTLYHWFTEGWDTKDLQDAKALLTELS